MSLAELSLEDVRCLRRAELHLHPGQNLIWGDNASGKTSLLEAIFLLGRGRSFRTRSSERLIRHGEARLRVVGKTIGPPPESIGVEVSRTGGTIAKVRGAFVPSMAELSRAFAVQVIEPGAHKLIEEGAQRRRRWMDWAVFHVEPSFIDVWSRYARALKQRNTALKTMPDQASMFEGEVARHGEVMANLRRDFIERLQPHWATAVHELTGLEIELHYARGWAADMTLGEALAASRDRDIHRGVTHVGPHRADIVVRLERGLARETLSRGQQKLVAAAMTLSQLSLIRELTGTIPTLLLDDPAAELDRERLGRFVARVRELQCQLVVTSLSPEVALFGAPDRVFHVKQGTVSVEA
ncbi:MAG TPA: DNA replication/repair protein RecF [Steroidobacteraceae bacterium]|nr:DNA replication/repair protein RecF [Steroidobacteraceae bacterium]